MDNIEVIFEWDPERLDIYLTKQFPYSRSFFHHIIERWWVLVNDKISKKSLKLKPWDRITIDNLERYLSPVILDETPNINIPIIKEEKDYLVINKPKWVLSHPNSIWDLSKPSVVWFLYHHYKTLPSVWNFIRAWLLHRLDKDTDGLMIIAKTERGLEHFKNLFKEKSEKISFEEKDSVPLKKWYRCVCYLTPKGQLFLKEIKNNLPFIIQEPVIAKVPNAVPKIGITLIEKIDNLDKGTISLSLQIFTWRTHQIRYHLSSHWLPILWDYLYWKDENIPMELTAYKLSFIGPDWDNITIELPNLK